MFKKTRIGIVFYISMLMAVLCLGSCSDKQKAEFSEVDGTSSQPNIIFILTDDLGWGDLGVFYQNQRRQSKKSKLPWHATPNLDKLAKSGAQLPNHYAAAPVCAPSRASLLLGVSQGHANVRDNQFDKALGDDHTLATVLKEAGYATAIIGKWGLQGLEGDSPETWDAYPTKRGFDYFLGYVRHRDGHNHYPAHEARERPKSELYLGTKEISDKLKGVYTTDLFTATAKKWITEQKRSNSNQPFFLYLAYDTPHAGLQIAAEPYPEGGGLQGGVQWIGESGNFINTANKNIDRYIYPDYAAKDWPEAQKRFASMVRRIDSGVGDLMQLLKDLGIYENTLVVFSSDNGPHKESYGYGPYEPTFFDSYGILDGIKRDVWEGGIRMPTLAAWPGHIPAGRIVKDASANYDWLATFADVAGLPIPANSDGVSLVPSLTGEGTQKDGVIYVEYEQGGRTPAYEEFAPQHRNRKRGQMQMIRLGDYVGVRYNIQSGNDDFEIYNIVKDPNESHNLAAGGNVPERIKNLQQKMKAQILQVRMPNASAPRPYDDAPVPAAAKDIEVEPGVTWKAFEGNFPWLPKVWGLKADAEGTAERPQPTVQQNGNQILFFKGYLDIPRDGTYTFSLSTDRAALLRIHKATVIDTGFDYKSGSLQSGTIKLEEGLHPFRIYYMHKGEGEPLLQLQWSGPGINQAPIPAKVFYHRK